MSEEFSTEGLGFRAFKLPSTQNLQRLVEGTQAMPLHQSSGRWRIGLSLALVTATLWGVLPIALKVVLQAVDVYTVTWFRFLVSFGLLGLFLAARGQLPTWGQMRKAKLSLLAIAILFLALNYGLFLHGLDQTSPTNSQVILQLAPVFFGMGALVVFKERYTHRQWIGLAILVLGLTLFFDAQISNLLSAPAPYLLGSGLLVLSAIAWAVYALAQKQILTVLSSGQIMWIIYGGGMLLFSPAASPAQLVSLTPLQWFMLLFSALNTLLAYGAFAEALDHWDASRVSAVLSITPIMTLASVFAVSQLVPSLLLPEPIAAMSVAGAMLVVVGSLAIALGQQSS